MARITVGAWLAFLDTCGGRVAVVANITHVATEGAWGSAPFHGAAVTRGLTFQRLCFAQGALSTGGCARRWSMQARGAQRARAVTGSGLAGAGRARSALSITVELAFRTAALTCKARFSVALRWASPCAHQLELTPQVHQTQPGEPSVRAATLTTLKRDRAPSRWTHGAACEAANGLPTELQLHSVLANR